MTPEQQMDRLEREIRQVRIDFDRFFSGAQEVVLRELEQRRHRISHELKALRSSNLKSVELGFRLTALEARFHSYSELIGRRVRYLEEGAPAAARRLAEAHRGEARRPVDRSAERSFEVEGAVSEEAVETLYRGLQERSAGGPRFDVASFRTYLERQLETIRERTGCDRVLFRISEEDGKMKLKARPVRPPGSTGLDPAGP